MKKNISRTISWVFFILFTALPLIGNNDNQCSVFNALEFKTKKILETSSDLCDWTISRTDLIMKYITSEDDHFYLESSGDDHFLERIQITVNNEIIKIIEDPIIIDKIQRITGDHSFFKSEASNGIVNNGLFQSTKVVMNGHLLFENDSFWELPILKLYIPKKCDDIQYKKIQRLIEKHSQEIFNYIVKKLYGPLECRLSPEQFNLEIEFITQDLLDLLEEALVSNDLNSITKKIMLAIEEKYQSTQKVYEKTGLMPFSEKEKLLFSWGDEFNIKIMLRNFQKTVRQLP